MKLPLLLFFCHLKIIVNNNIFFLNYLSIFSVSKMYLQRGNGMVNRAVLERRLNTQLLISFNLKILKTKIITQIITISGVPILHFLTSSYHIEPAIVGLFTNPPQHSTKWKSIIDSKVQSSTLIRNKLFKFLKKLSVKWIEIFRNSNKN